MIFGRTAMEERRNVEAEKLFMVALTEAEKFGENDERLTETLMTLARFHRNRGKFIRSRSFYERALDLRQRNLGMDDSLVVRERNNLVNLYYILGETAKVESLGVVASEITAKAFGEKHPELAEIYRTLAEAYQESGKFQQADSLYHLALTIFENHHGDMQHEIIVILNNLGVFYHDQQRYTEAESLYCRSLELNEKLVGSGSDELLSALTNLAKLKNETSDFATAESLYIRAFDIQSKQRSRSYFKKISLQRSLAETCVAQKKYKKASKHYKQALEYIDTTTGMHPDLVEILENYTEVLMVLNKNEEAKELKQRAIRLKKALNK